MKKLLYIFLFIGFFGFSQVGTPTKTMAQWKADLDALRAGTGDRYIRGAIKSNSAFDGYYESYEFLNGHVKAWQASGDFDYLDMALDEAQSSVLGSFQLDSLYNALDNVSPNTCCSEWYRFPAPYRGLVHLPNYWDGALGLNNTLMLEYANNAPNTNSYERADNQFNENNRRYKHDPLTDPIYWRYVADMLRIMNHNQSIMGLTSNNGQTYQQRYDKILAYVIQNVWEKWFEYPLPTWPPPKEQFVYRVNTHTSSHLVSVAVSLYSITGEQKYLDHINDFLWDFGAPPDSPDRVLDGIGLQDRITVQGDGDYTWTGDWSNSVGSGWVQDFHAFAETHLWAQLWEEGLGGTAPNGEIEIDFQFLTDMGESLMHNMVTGWNGGTQIPTTKVDGSSSYQDANLAGGYWMYPLAFATPLILDYMEDNSANNVKKDMGRYGTAMYAAAFQGIDGASIVYPSTGSVDACPVVVNTRNGSTGNTTIVLNNGDTYTELGATWTDNEDSPGSGSATVGGDTVNTAVNGTYEVTYSHTDTNSCTTTITMTVIVQDAVTTRRINAGGPAFTYNSIDWEADQYFSTNSYTASNSSDIANTNNDFLYQNERWSSGDLVYEIPIDNGDYDITLHFSEMYWNVAETGGVGDRVFDLTVENETTITNFDIFDLAGGSLTAYTQTFTGVTVSDGLLTVTMDPSVNGPSINGIEIVPSGTSEFFPVASAGADQTIELPTNTGSLSGMGSDPDGGTVTFLWTQESGPNTSIISSITTTNTNISNLIEGTYVYRLTVTDDESDSSFDEVTVTVVDFSNEIQVESITLDDGDVFHMDVGDVGLPSATVLPANATNKAINYSLVDNGGLAYKDPESGEIVAEGKGTFTVIGSADDGSGVSVEFRVIIGSAFKGKTEEERKKIGKASLFEN